jgi:hypothetical protein
MAPKTTGAAHFSHSSMRVTYIRVRTTSSSRAPARTSAFSMLRSVCTAWA